ANILARLAARIWVGFEGTTAGAAVGGAALAATGPLAVAGSVIGAIGGGILGSYAGEIAVDAIWYAATKAIGSLSRLFGVDADTEETPESIDGVFDRLKALGVPDGPSKHILGILRKQFDARKTEDATYTIDKLFDDVMKDVKENQAVLPGEDSIVFSQVTINGAVTGEFIGEDGKTAIIDDKDAKSWRVDTHDVRGV